MGTWRPCCSMPHGQSSIFAIVVTTIAFVISRLSQTTCHYVNVNLKDTVSEETEFGFGLVSREGFFTYNNDLYRGCVRYSDEDRDVFFDATWRAAMAMGALSTAFGGITLIFVCFTGCVAFPVSIFKLFALCLVIAGICDALTLLALSSDLCQDANDCDMGGGAGLAIASTVLYFVSACFVAKIPEAAPDEEELMSSRDAPEDDVMKLEEKGEDEAEEVEKAEKSEEPGSEEPEGPKTEA